MSVNPFTFFIVAEVILKTIPKPESIPYLRTPEAGQGFHGPVSSNEI